MIKEKIRRHERILSNLSELTYATREQLQIINKLGGDRNARRILLEMEREGLIKSVRYDKKIYYISNKGNDYIGKGNSRLNKKEIQHVLMRNDLYIKLGMPKTWKKEAQIIVNDEVVLISDARFNVGDKYYFIEIDHKQSMKTNIEKIKKYKEVFRMMYREFGYHPKLIWYTLSDVRKQSLAKACQNHAVNYQIY